MTAVTAAGPENPKGGSLASPRLTRFTVSFRVGVLTWAWILLLGCLVTRGGEAVNYFFNPDEFYFLHSAWMISHGYQPYRDFWANHPPLFISLLKPVVARFDGDPSSLFLVVRLLAWLVNLGLFALVAALAARQRPWAAGLYAALLVSVNLTVFEATVTVRYDSLSLVCQLVALALLARGMRSERARDLLAAGAALGLALAMTPKALFGLSGLVLGYLVHEVSTASRMQHRRALMGPIRRLAVLLVGSLGTFTLVLAVLLPFDLWPLMVKLVFWDSLGSPNRFSPLTRYLLRDIAKEPMAGLVMLGGFGVAIRQWWVGSPGRDPGETLLLVGGLWFGVTYLFFMPSAYQQSALPFIAVLAIFGGRLLATAHAQLAFATSRAKGVAWAISLALLVSWIAVGSAIAVLPKNPPFRRTSAYDDYLRMIQYVLILTDPEDAVFDGNSAYIFRPQASYYGSLIEVILHRMNRGELIFDIPDRCERLGCKVIMVDPRIARLPQTIQAWIRDNYVRSPAFQRVLLHKSFVLRSGSTGVHGSRESP